MAINIKIVTDSASFNDYDAEWFAITSFIEIKEKITF